MVSREVRNLNEGRNGGGVRFWHGLELLLDPKVGDSPTLRQGIDPLWLRLHKAYSPDLAYTPC